MPTIIYFHGGGWVVGDADTHTVTCARLAHELVETPHCAPKTEGNIEKGDGICFDEFLFIPLKFFFLPWFGIKPWTTNCFVFHMTSCYTLIMLLPLTGNNNHDLLY